MRTAIILGTRPEIIKMSPVIRACERGRDDYYILHTGQHYSREMDLVFFEQLGLRSPAYNLDIGSGTHGAQTGRMLIEIEKVLVRDAPDCVLVQGDTNSVVAGALAAAKLRIPVGHVEAGLRSRDPSMPEELNRIVADHVASHLFAPTDASARLLRGEGIRDAKIFMTGNTVVDALLENRGLAHERSRFLERNGLEAGGYVLLTAHRQENVDQAARFRGILAGAQAVGAAFGLPVVYPIHPRAKKMLEGLRAESFGIRFIDPLDYMDFLVAESAARIVLTDSGGVQEEACVLRVPCVTLRDNTERPETVEVGANVLAGTDPARILDAARRMDTAPKSWPNPFGDGRSGLRIMTIMRDALVHEMRPGPRTGRPALATTKNPGVA